MCSEQSILTGICDNWERGGAPPPPLGLSSTRQSRLTAYVDYLLHVPALLSMPGVKTLYPVRIRTPSHASHKVQLAFWVGLEVPVCALAQVQVQVEGEGGPTCRIRTKSTSLPRIAQQVAGGTCPTSDQRSTTVGRLQHLHLHLSVSPRCWLPLHCPSSNSRISNIPASQLSTVGVHLQRNSDAHLSPPAHRSSTSTVCTFLAQDRGIKGPRHQKTDSPPLPPPPPSCRRHARCIR